MMNVRSLKTIMQRLATWQLSSFVRHECSESTQLMIRSKDEITVQCFPGFLIVSYAFVFQDESFGNLIQLIANKNTDNLIGITLILVLALEVMKGFIRCIYSIRT